MQQKDERLPIGTRGVFNAKKHPTNKEKPKDNQYDTFQLFLKINHVILRAKHLQPYKDVLLYQLSNF